MRLDIIALERLRKKRWQKKLKRADKKARKAQKARRVTVKAMHPALSLLRKNLRGEKRPPPPPKDGRFIIEIPRVFSFTDDPEAVLNVIYSLLSIPDNRSVREIFIDHSRCEQMDLGASAVFDVCALYVFGEQSRRRRNFSFGGRLPANKHVDNLIRCMGITKHLKVAGVEPSPEFDNSLIKFPLFKGHKNHAFQATGNSDQERASTKLAKHIDSCFRKTANRRLSDTAMSLICTWAGEIITNAEEHSGQDAWFAIGYLEPLARNASPEAADQSAPVVGECQLVIFNFGKSIYETLDTPTRQGAMTEDIRRLVAIHQQKSFFGSANKFNEPDLWTLYGLQDGVSRFSGEPGGEDRGRGTVNMIEAFTRLGKSTDVDKEPVMTIVSGSTRIVLDKKYPLQRKALEGGSRRIIAFNKNNSLEEKPDDANVHSLRGRFPGTVLTFRFFIDKMYLDSLQGGTNQ